MASERRDKGELEVEAVAAPGRASERRRGRAQRREEQRAQRREAEKQAAATGKVSSIPATKEPTALSTRRIEQRLAIAQPRPAFVAEQSHRFALPLPGRRKRPYGLYLSFVLCVIAPVLAASAYYCFYASSQYVAEFRFSVQDMASTSSSSSSSSMTSLLSSVGLGGVSANNNYIVTDFLSSREAVDELQKRIDVVKLYSRPNIDWWSRFDGTKPIEDFVAYWQKTLTAQYDQITGIATAQVRAFSPADALLISKTLVKMSEELINKIANRSALAAVKFAEVEVGKAEARLKKASAAMANFRNRTGVIDPATSLVASNSTLTQTLRANLAQLQTQLATLQRQKLAPTSPIFVTLQNQIKSTKDQLHAVEAAVAQARDGSALSDVMSEFEQLTLENTFAQNMVKASMEQLELAKANAASQHLFITPYVRPSLPESSTYPKPLRAVSTIGTFAFIIWVCGLMIVRSIRERFA